jgi:Uncharacterized protein, possibly involved in motility
MIVLTRLNGPPFALNPDLIERVDATPDTVITLVGGVKYVVGESLDDLVRLIHEFRGQVIASAYAAECGRPRERNLRVLPSSDTEAELPHSNGF